MYIYIILDVKDTTDNTIYTVYIYSYSTVLDDDCVKNLNNLLFWSLEELLKLTIKHDDVAGCMVVSLCKGSFQLVEFVMDVVCGSFR